VPHIVVQQALFIPDGQVHHMLLVTVVSQVVVLDIVVHLTASMYFISMNELIDTMIFKSISCGASTQYCGGQAVVVVPAPTVGQCGVTGCQAGTCCSSYG
jgi:hypothetical protein